MVNFCPAIRVPNAPCGVERRLERLERELEKRVPNAPCGVERSAGATMIKIL